jgi:uncharacterized protein (DUF1684 family)
MSELTSFREAKDLSFAQDRNSPLTRAQRRKFRGLDYFPENPKLRFLVKITELSDRDRVVIELTTSTGGSNSYVRWGTFTFAVGGEPATLTVYQGLDAGELFLPFADATSGHESYGAGRYLDLLPLEDGRYLVDFNFSYNPYCAYNPNWSCPVPPAENRLRVPIRAGEKTFPDALGH